MSDCPGCRRPCCGNVFKLRFQGSVNGSLEVVSVAFQAAGDRFVDRAGRAFSKVAVLVDDVEVPVPCYVQVVVLNRVVCARGDEEAPDSFPLAGRFSAGIHGFRWFVVWQKNLAIRLHLGCASLGGPKCSAESWRGLQCC